MVATLFTIGLLTFCKIYQLISVEISALQALCVDSPNYTLITDLEIESFMLFFKESGSTSFA